MVGLGLAIAGVLFALQAILAGRISTKVLGTLLLVMTTPVLYFMQTYGVVIDASMLRNALQTDTREAADLFSWRLLVYLTLGVVLPTWWLWQKPLHSMAWRPRMVNNLLATLVGLIVTAAMIALLKGDLATLMRSQKSMRYQITPLNVMYGAGKLAAGERKALPFVSLRTATVADITNTASPLPVLVLVVGETARSDHFTLNGYRSASGQSTTPKLDAVRQEIVSFKDVPSCGTNTADSVPCMFSHLPRETFFDRKSNYDTLLDLLQRAGFAVTWLDNNSSCKGVCARVPNEDLMRASHPQHCTAD